MANRRLIIFRIILLLIFPSVGNAQEFTISSNTLGLLNLGTINGEFGLRISQKWSLYMQTKVNPFEFKSSNAIMPNGYAKQFQNKQFTMALGAKYWLWYVNSGWFIGYQGSYTKYNRGGLIKQDTHEGDAYGVTAFAGYSLILTEHWNLELAAGVISGYTRFTKYECPKCGTILKQGQKFFIAPNNIMVQVAYLF